jgi:hypothetical protein
VLPEHVPWSPPRTPSSWLAVGAATLVIALVGIVLVAVGRGPAGGADTGLSSPNAARMVFDAAQKTLAQRSAAVTVSGTVKAAGRTFTVTGSGAVDFVTNSMTLTMTTDMGFGTLVEHEIFINGHLYLGMDIGGRDMSAVTGGAHWIAMPVAQSSAQLGNGDPVSELTMLAAHGNTVVSLGTSTMDGVKLTGYGVTPTRAEMQKNEQRMLATMKLDATERAQLERTWAMLQPPTIDVWFDSAKLLRKMRMNMSLTGTAAAADGDIDMTFDHYGTPVQVTAPNSSDVIDYVTFLHKLESSGVKFP